MFAESVFESAGFRLLTQAMRSLLRILCAVGGVYDPRIHLNEVVMPVLKKWRIFEREDFTGEAAWMRDDLALLVKELEEASDKFDESKQRYLERQARRTEQITASRVLKSQGTLTLSGR
jgi:acyl-[acyl-carrier-protein] desaturase